MAENDQPPLRAMLFVLGIVLAWVIGSTVVGYTLMYLSGWGHAGGLFLYAAWFVALAGLPIHLVLRMRKPVNGPER
jgi:hypothetical protein